MGQYYKPISIEKNEGLYSHDYDNGLKLMEHSYIGNNFVSAVEHLLIKGGKWHGDRIVWAGDYADPETDENGNPIKNEEGDEMNLWSRLGDDRIIKPFPHGVPKIEKEYKYLINHTKKEYVNKDDAKKVSWSHLKIHPLPLLTCEGNGRGGGDYRKDDSNIGRWARDVIEVSNERPTKYKKLKVNFSE